ncbi:hypothetical protein ACW9HR_02360 [Nocardia gipuzkoensis]
MLRAGPQQLERLLLADPVDQHQHAFGLLDHRAAGLERGLIGFVWWSGLVDVHIPTSTGSSGVKNTAPVMEENCTP